MAKYDFFISYSTKDKDVAFKVLEAIESTGHSCWIAPRNIPYGTSYARAIMEGIDECDTFIVIITDNSIKSEDVLNEIDNAHAIKRTIIPVLLTETRLPRELNYYLSRTQWLNLDAKNPHRIATLLNLSATPTQPPKSEDISEHKIEKGEADVAPKEEMVTKHEIPKEMSSAKKMVDEYKNEPVKANNPEADKKTLISKQRSIPKAKLFGILLIVLSLAWMIVSFARRTPNYIIFAVSFFASVILFVLTVIALFRPSGFGMPSKKECFIFMGFPSIFLFIASMAYNESNITSDTHANTIIESSNMQDSVSDSSASNAQESEITKLGEEAFKREEYEVAVKYFKEMSDSGNLYGQFMLGKCYYSGLGVQKDFNIAFELFSKAAQGNMPEAINSKGICYLKGRGTKQDFSKAAECFREAAERGLPIAQANLADCYVYGNGVEQNYKTAKEWYEKAAEQDYAPAAFNIGRLYYNGRPGVGLNYGKAAYWYRMAANSGLADAQNSIGVCYLKGQGVERNHNEAFKWFEKAAALGNSAGLYNLANCYRDGSGVDKDKGKAKKFYQEAADKGSQAALIALKEL